MIGDVYDYTRCLNCGFRFDDSDEDCDYCNKCLIGKIRHEIFVRQKAQCISCGAIFTEDQMHMHEKVFRGKGGKISLDNSEGLCFTCHIDRKTFGHGKRKPQFGGEE